MSSTKPSYAAQVLRILEANVGRSMTLDALEQAIRERWGSCSRKCLVKAIAKNTQLHKVVEHAERSYELAPAAKQRVIRKRNKTQRPTRMTGYNCFVKAQMRESADAEQHPAPSITSRMSVVAARWRAMDEAARAKYVQEAADHNEAAAAAGLAAAAADDSGAGELAELPEEEEEGRAASSA